MQQEAAVEADPKSVEDAYGEVRTRKRMMIHCWEPWGAAKSSCFSHQDSDLKKLTKTYPKTLKCRPRVWRKCASEEAVVVAVEPPVFVVVVVVYLYRALVMSKRSKTGLKLKVSILAGAVVAAVVAVERAR